MLDLKLMLLDDNGNVLATADTSTLGETLSAQLADKAGLAANFEGLARLAHLQGRWERGARLFGVAAAVRESRICSLARARAEDIDLFTGAGSQVTVNPPNLNAVQELAVGMVRLPEAGGRIEPLPGDTLELWVNDLRLDRVEIGVTGEQDSDRARGERANLRQHLDAGHLRHALIGDDDRDVLLDRRREQQHLGTQQRHRASALGEPLVPADADADPGVGGVPHGRFAGLHAEGVFVLDTQRLELIHGADHLGQGGHRDLRAPAVGQSAAWQLLL